MSRPFLPEEHVTPSWSRLEVARPGSWWRVKEVYIRLTGGASLVYGLSGFANPAETRDPRRRTALEAFSALPLEAERQRLQAYLDTLKGVEGSRTDQNAMRDCLPEMLSFVQVFGPIGIGWGMELPVLNPDADRLEREVDRLKHRELERQFGKPLREGSARHGAQGWKVTFYGMAAGRWGTGTVRRWRTWPSGDFETRLELDDRLFADLLWSIMDEQRDLLAAIQLANAIAGGTSTEIRDAARAVGGGSGDVTFNLGIPGETDWSRAIAGDPPPDQWQPFAPGSRVTWPIFGRMVLADLIGRQLNFVEPRVEIDGSDHFLMAWRARSLLEVIYLELFEHVRKRLEFGLGTCGVCGGVIVRTRKASSVRNRWHRGCAAAGRQRNWRQANRRDRAPPLKQQHEVV